MTLTGNMLIGAQSVKGAGAPLHAIDPARGEPLQPGFRAGTAEDVRRELALLKSSGAAVLSGHDYGNARFGVTRAVDEALGGVDEQCGMCWLKRAAR